LKEGYCRGISAVDGSCAVGYHKNGIPNGKFSQYKSNGEFATPQGIYEGSTCTSKIEIASFMEKIIKDA
jgi:hypothetical protein